MTLVPTCLAISIISKKLHVLLSRENNLVIFINTLNIRVPDF